MTNVKIDRGVAFDGAAIVQGGIGNYLLLINKDDLDGGAITEDAVSHEIETITLDAGTLAYKIESSKGSMHIIPSCIDSEKSGSHGFIHSVEVRITDVSQLSREAMAKARWNKLVALIPLASGQSEMFGRAVGMRIAPGSWEYKPGDGDVGGSLKFTLQTPESDPPEIEHSHLIESTFDILTLTT
jgi:hypothetical protein